MELFFENGGCFVRHYDNQASGNPVKIGDGYATVTGYKLPQPLDTQAREGGSKVSSPKSGYRPGCARHGPGLSGINFSVKRRMRPARSANAEWDSLNAFILRFAGGEGFLCFTPLRWSLNR